jgi:glycosyltransferase involved in cell wall biosynthesis
VTEIHQFLPVLRKGDATGDHTLRIRDVLRDMGIVSHIWCQHNDTRDRRLARDFRDFDAYRPSGQAWVLYQASTGSPVADYVIARPEPKIIDYHNMSPSHLWEAWEPHRAVELEMGRRQLAALAKETQLALADSAYNELELIDLGYDNTAVVPILLELDELASTADPGRVRALEAEKAKGGATWLFVSQIMPHKAHHDLVMAFAIYRRVFDPDARLYIAGFPGCLGYLDAVREFVSALGLDDAVRIHAPVSEEEKMAFFTAADVYVSVSEHEGFSVPPLEAMAHDVPVVAYGAAAVPATVADAGVVLRDKTPSVVATAVHRVLSDGALRNQLTANGRRRIQDFRFETTAEKLRGLIRDLIAA